jgi:GT2 family glycosyltransferase
MNNSKRLSSAGRNIGFKNGKGDIFVVIDGHCWIGHDQLFKNVVACFEKSGADCLGRPQPLDPPDITEFQKAVALARSSRIGHGGDSLIYSDFEGFASPVSNGAVYKRHIFEKIGFVDESFDVCEDVDFNYRVEKAGFKSYMNPSIAVKYYPRENLSSLWKQMVRYGKGRYMFFRKHPETFSLSGIIPAIFAFAMLLLPPISITSSALRLLPIAFLGTYLMVILAVSFRITTQKSFKGLIQLVAIFFFIHLGLGWGYIVSFLQSPSAYRRLLSLQ